MPSTSMIRKQLYITREQDRALKQRAREQGASEAEVVREALGRHLRPEVTSALASHRRKALKALLEGNERLAQQLSFPKGYRFNREELYAEREERWFKDS